MEESFCEGLQAQYQDQVHRLHEAHLQHKQETRLATAQRYRLEFCEAEATAQQAFVEQRSRMQQYRAEVSEMRERTGAKCSVSCCG